MSTRAALALCTVAVGLSACTPTPMSMDRAMEICSDRARDALGPRGYIAAGASSTGASYTSIGIGIHSDFLLGRDPEGIYQQCVLARTGQLPPRPARL